MIGDDQVDTELARARRCIDRSDPAIYGDDDAGAHPVRPLDSLRPEPVSVVDPMGHQVGDVRTQGTQGEDQDHGSGDAVDVVIPVDDDALAGGNSRQQAIGRSLHLGEGERRVQLVETGMEERTRCGDAVNPAAGENASGRRQQAELLLQVADDGGIVFAQNPGRTRQLF